MHWHLQWQKLTPHLTTNTMGENATTLTRKLAKLRGRMACLPRYSCETWSNAFWTISLVRTIVKKRKHLCDLVSHSNKITSEQSNPNYVTTFHVQPLKSLQSGTTRLFCLKWRPVTRKRDVRDQRRKWSNTSRKEWTGFRVDTRHSTRRHLLLYNCTKGIKINI